MDGSVGVQVKEQQFGNHLGRFLPPDLVFIRFQGDLVRDDARCLSEWFSAFSTDSSARFLVDVRGLGTIGPEARRELATTRTVPDPTKSYETDLVFIGANMRTKILMTVIVAAATLTANQKIRSHFFPTLEAAAVWAGVETSALG
jgi:hypothetical protein